MCNVQDTFQKVCYCYLIGIRVESECEEIEKNFLQILPKTFVLPKTGDICKVCKLDERYQATWHGTLPPKLPSLLILIECALKDENLPTKALEPHITSLVMQWYNIACTLCWSPDNNSDLIKCLGVQKQDMPLLSYWIPQCK